MSNSDRDKDLPIHNAAREDPQRLAAMLARDPSLTQARGWFGRLPLHVAAESDQADSVRSLLDSGADPNTTENLHRQTPLHHAVGADSIDCVELLLKAGADVNASDKRGETPVFYCKSRPIIERLATAGANLSVISDRGQYPFQYCAAYARSVEVMEFWIEQGIDINDIPAFGWPALNAVTGRSYGAEGSPHKDNDLQLLRLLIRHGASINLEAAGGFPLYDACKNWHLHLVEPLLLAGADVNQQRHNTGDTALHVAVLRQTREAVEILVRYGADVNIANRHRMTPVDIGEDTAIRELLEPQHIPVVHPVPTEEQVTTRLRGIPEFASVPLEGCTESEIDDLEKKFEVTFPKSYRRFLSKFGNGAGEFMVSDHWCFQAQELDRLEVGEDFTDFCDLPERAFVFACRNGYAWVFFLSDGSDDPPVFLFDDGPERTYRQIARSIWEFIESLVIDYEGWSGVKNSPD